MSERKGRSSREEQKKRPRRCCKGAEEGGSMMSEALDTTPQLAEKGREDGIKKAEEKIFCFIHRVIKL